MKTRILGVALAVAMIGASNVYAIGLFGGAVQKDGAVQKGAVQKGAVQKGAVQKGAVQKGAVQKGCRGGLFSRHHDCGKGAKCAPAPKCRTPLFARHHRGCDVKGGVTQKHVAQKHVPQKHVAQKGAVQKGHRLGLFSRHHDCGKGAKCAPAPKCHKPLFARHHRGCDVKGGAAQKCGATQKGAVQKGAAQKGAAQKGAVQKGAVQK